MQTFSANGKLLITAEYFVLDGAKALAMPVKFGQTLQLINNKENDALVWNSCDDNNFLWFNAKFNAVTYEILFCSDVVTAKTLSNILKKAKQLSELDLKATKIETHLNFPREWGLGTSSTLIYLVAKVFDVNPFQLSSSTLGGSGYDIACAGASKVIKYQISGISNEPLVESVDWQPNFSANLFFVYLGKKQNSRDGIAHYRASGKKNISQVDTVSLLTESFINASTLFEFEKLILEHERLVQSAIKLERAKDLYFHDYWGEIKSLGAWGGDFVLATSNQPIESTKKYFSERGFNTFIPFHEMVL